MKKFILKYLTFAGVSLSGVASISLAGASLAKPGENSRPGVRIVYLDEMNVARITIHPHGTVLSFPIKPEVHVGKKEVFDIVYVKNDLVISANMPGAVTNIFVYLMGRRFTLKLVQSSHGGDEIVAIRDPLDAAMQVEVK